MPNTLSPVFDPDDDLSAPLEVDYNAIIAPLISQRTDSPIVRESKVVDVAALLQQSIPRTGSALASLLEKLPRLLNAIHAAIRTPVFLVGLHPPASPPIHSRTTPRGLAGQRTAYRKVIAVAVLLSQDSFGRLRNCSFHSCR